MGLLDGKVALVTGAARGMGRSHCARLAAEGADIVAFDLCGPPPGAIDYPAATSADLEETAGLVEATGRAILAVQGDVRDSVALEALVAAGIERFGRLDVVAANAGILMWGRFWELEEEDWQAVLDTNLTGVWRTLKAVAPPMIAAGRGGSIIVVSSVAGLKALPGQAHYVASKHGVVGLANTAALELASHGIRVNTIHPWGVETAMMTSRGLGQIFESDPGFRHSYHAAMTEPAMAQPADISDAVVWLASDLSRTVTGTQLPLDLGATKI